MFNKTVTLAEMASNNNTTNGEEGMNARASIAAFLLISSRRGIDVIITCDSMPKQHFAPFSATSDCRVRDRSPVVHMVPANVLEWRE